MVAESPLHQLAKALTDVEGVAVIENIDVGEYRVELTCVERHRWTTYATERVDVPPVLAHFEALWETGHLHNLLSEEIALEAGLLGLGRD